MSSGLSRRVALVGHDVSENIASIFRVLGLHNCVTFEPWRHPRKRNSSALYRVPLWETNQQRLNGNTTVESYHPEDGGDMFSETSGLTRTTRLNTPEDIHHYYKWCTCITDRTHTVTTPCGGGLYLHRSPASCRRRPKMEPTVWGVQLEI
jgi:hypothetical protein